MPAQTSSLKPVASAWGRAFRAQFSARMLTLSLVPLALSLLLWGGLLAMFGQDLFDYLQGLLTQYGWDGSGDSKLATMAVGVLKAMAVPVVAILLLLPVMSASSLLFMGVLAMPAIERHVGRQYPKLERKEGGTFVGSLLINVTSVLVFAVLWLCTIPLYVFPPLAVLVQTVIWGWVTSRVMTYDALAAHASEKERKALMRLHRRPLLMMGLASGVLGALPGIAWIGGALLSFVLFPFLAILSSWLYVLIFLFTGLWFQYYCLRALEDLRAAGTATLTPA